MHRDGRPRGARQYRLLISPERSYDLQRNADPPTWATLAGWPRSQSGGRRIPTPPGGGAYVHARRVRESPHWPYRAALVGSDADRALATGTAGLPMARILRPADLPELASYPLPPPSSTDAPVDRSTRAALGKRLDYHLGVSEGTASLQGPSQADIIRRLEPGGTANRGPSRRTNPDSIGPRSAPFILQARTAVASLPSVFHTPLSNDAVTVQPGRSRPPG